MCIVYEKEKKVFSASGFLSSDKLINAHKFVGDHTEKNTISSLQFARLLKSYTKNKQITSAFNWRKKKNHVLRSLSNEKER